MSARVLNEAVDRLLEAVNGLIIDAGLDKMNVSDLEHDWEMGWNFVRVSGTLSCRGGWLRKLSSLRRTGDVILATHDDSFTLKAKLGFGELAFGYKTCKASAKHLLKMTTSIDATVEHNSLDLAVKIGIEGDRCVATLEDIRVTELGRIRISTGHGVLKELEGQLIEWVTNRFRADIQEAVNRELMAVASKAVEDFSQEIIGQMVLQSLVGNIT